MPDIEGDDGAERAYYVRLLSLYTMETRRVQLCTLQKLCYLAVPRDLEIAHWCRAISRLARNFGILEIAQIPKLRGTYILRYATMYIMHTCFVVVNE